MTKTTLIESTSQFHDSPDGLILEQRQVIPDEFISELKRNKIDADHQRAGEFMLAASIPEVIHLEWLRQGYDCTREPVRKTIARLKAHGLDAFVATNKRV